MVSLGPRRWYPPQYGWVKVNIDAAVFLESECIGIGSVIRDNHGVFVRARNHRTTTLYQPPETEAIGLEKALLWVKDLGYMRCVSETDAKALANACRKKTMACDLVSPL